MSERPFLDMFKKMLDERDGWPGAPSDKRLGLRYLEVADGRVVAEWHATDEMTIPTGTIHGGHIAAVADSVCSMAALTGLEKRGMSAGTLTLNVEFYRYARPGLMAVEATVTHLGRKNVFVSCAINDPEGRPLAGARATFSRNEARQQ